LRLAEAKKLLRETRRGIEAIATAVGYYNSAGFIRTFKKYEGITPGQYRSNCKLQTVIKKEDGLDFK
jgi:YesN/AraC family two-component response regulator